ncbi:tyrosine-type recombinase/integrase [Pseudonocardia ailaonensis]
MPRAGARRRTRGSIDPLPSGALRVRVHAGADPVTGKRHTLVEIVPPGPRQAAEAEAARTRLLNQVDERRHPRTAATVNQLLDKYFEVLALEATTTYTYVGYADKHIRPLIGQVKVGALGGEVFDSLYAELRRCRDHCDRGPRTDHRTSRAHDCDERCRPHECRPLANASIRHVHFILSGALKRAVRWRWIAANPIVEAEPPTAPPPAPAPPSATEAAAILAESWKDPDWGLLVWVVMVTGLRRGELCGLRWRDLDLDRGTLTVARGIAQRDGRAWEKTTKTHQQRRLALDDETVELLRAHHETCGGRAQALSAVLASDAFVFSLAPDGSTHLLPDSVSQRYGKLARKLGIATSIHKLRHYSATELISAGVDIRTVAGRLGHGGGGTTTLRVYTAWVAESDQRAATNLFSRLPARPAERARLDDPSLVARHPYEVLAVELRREVENGTWTEWLPSNKELARTHDVSVGTAQRAARLLAEWGVVAVLPGRGVRVLAPTKQ